jgi:peptide-methionine (R)-S-oxide reductase
MTTTTRRQALFGGAGLLTGAAFLGLSRHGHGATAETFEVTHTDEEWRKLLSPAAYNVLRQQGTEAPGSSPLDAEERPGVYHCAGCDLPVYSSKTKYHSGTGWPSFWAPLDDAVRTSVDKSWFATRTEVHCRRCGGHLGHVFDDGPQPTGKRYCMDGVALRFAPGEELSS